jgi:signal transduction protein with GAF and PtsI domain
MEFQALSQNANFRCGEGLPGRVWQMRVPQSIEDVTASDYFTCLPAATAAGIRGAFAIPLGLFQEIFGVMAFFSHEKKIMHEELNNFLMSISSQIGQFMARKIAETERETIGKDAELTQRERVPHCSLFEGWGVRRKSTDRAIFRTPITPLPA